MDNNLVYMPAFRVRQQEILVLKNFQFNEHMYPLLEIVKEFDRSRNNEIQKSFEVIHNDIIANISAKRVFVDLPVYLKQSGAVKDEVVNFYFKIIADPNKRCEYLTKLTDTKKIIPVISSYLLKTGVENTIELQYNLLKGHYSKFAFRLFPLSFKEDIIEVKKLITESDYLILDLDQIGPYPSPPLKNIIKELKELNSCCKIMLRSAINSDIQNVKLEHGKVIMEADNNHIDENHMKSMGVNATGDFAGIKKDDLTAGGTISPGFIYYDAIENEYYGFRADLKDLSQFENKIVPDVLASEVTKRMRNNKPPYITEHNSGYNTLLNIQKGLESGKSQAKFKRIALEHYLYCMKVKTENQLLKQT